MTTRRKRVLLISLVLILSLPMLAIADPPSVVGRLNLVEGSVSFRPGSLDEWAPAMLNYPLSAGDHLWADQGSRAELHVGSTAVRLDGGTEISFLNLDDQIVQLGVSEGQLNVRLRRLDPGDEFEIITSQSKAQSVSFGQNGFALCNALVMAGGAQRCSSAWSQKHRHAELELCAPMARPVTDRLLRF